MSIEMDTADPARPEVSPDDVRAVGRATWILLAGIGVGAVWKMSAWYRVLEHDGEDDALLLALFAGQSIFSQMIWLLLLVCSIALVYAGSPSAPVNAVTALCWVAVVWMPIGIVASLDTGLLLSASWVQALSLPMPLFVLGVLRSRTIREASSVAIVGLSLTPALALTAFGIARAGGDQPLTFGLMRQAIGSSASSAAIAVVAAAILAALTHQPKAVTRLVVISASAATLVSLFGADTGLFADSAATRSSQEFAALYLQVGSAQAFPVLVGAIAIALFAHRQALPDQGPERSSLSATWGLGWILFLPTLCIALINQARSEARIAAGDVSDPQYDHELIERISRWRFHSIWITVMMVLVALGTN